MNEHDIYFGDLTPEAQHAVLEFYHIASPEDGNFDVLPIFTLFSDEERECEK